MFTAFLMFAVLSSLPLVPDVPFGDARSKVEGARELDRDQRQARQHREHKKGGEQEQRERRYKASALAGNIAPRELAWPPGEHRQRPPNLAFEVKHAVGEIVGKRCDRPVDMGRLSAMLTKAAGKRGAAIEAVALAPASSLASSPARLGLHRPRENPTGQRVRGSLDLLHAQPPSPWPSARTRPMNDHPNGLDVQGESERLHRGACAARLLLAPLAPISAKPALTVSARLLRSRTKLERRLPC